MATFCTLHASGSTLQSRTRVRRTLFPFWNFVKAELARWCIMETLWLSLRHTFHHEQLRNSQCLSFHDTYSTYNSMHKHAGNGTNVSTNPFLAWDT